MAIQEEEKAYLESKLREYKSRLEEKERNDKEDAVVCNESWISQLDASKPNTESAAAHSSVQILKQTATDFLSKGDFAQAIHFYTASIEAAKQQGLQDSQLAILHSNRALVHIKNHSYSQAVEDAQKARQLSPSWPKPLHRLAQAFTGLSQWDNALATCKEGVAICGGTTSEFQPLLDSIAVTAALNDCLAGFSGRKLEVRDAGEEAWLGREAPEDPELDGPAEPLLALPSTSDCDEDSAVHSSDSKGATACTSAGPAEQAALGLVRRGFSFRSLHAAVAAAADGDQIVLRKGIHNGLGETVHVSKRLLIRGEGVLGETRIDHRANCPALRINRSCLIQGLDIDMTGFREAVKVEGPGSVQPVCHNCIIRCSGDDAVNMCGKAAPVFSSCTLRARKCGVRAYEKATASLTDCKIEACSEQGIKTFESAALSLTRCTLADCEEDGIVAMDESSVRLEACTISSCKGPAVDLTDQAQLHATGCTFKDSMGAVWVWDNAKADVAESYLHSHDTYVVLADSPARASLQGCRIDGKLYVTDKAQADVLRIANKIVEPGHHVGAPPEDGAFEFVPNMYTRKQ